MFFPACCYRSLYLIIATVSGAAGVFASVSSVRHATRVALFMIFVAPLPRLTAYR
ncbi:uncharacterized membrane protein YsdA (DUF1294 family) [Arthrobacter sp. 1088]|nr:uncharacterized membrane protein YsdA (DUF1294 family) [Arthrobacter sp. 1088]